jgi:hypothetical protein
VRSCKLNKVKKNKHESESEFLIIIATIRIRTFTKSPPHKACSYNIHHTSSHNTVENRFPLDPGSPPPYGEETHKPYVPSRPSRFVFGQRIYLHPKFFKGVQEKRRVSPLSAPQTNRGTFSHHQQHIHRQTHTNIISNTKYDSLDVLICFAVFNTLQDTHISSPPSIHE